MENSISTIEEILKSKKLFLTIEIEVKDENTATEDTMVAPDESISVRLHLVTEDPEAPFHSTEITQEAIGVTNADERPASYRELAMSFVNHPLIIRSIHRAIERRDNLLRMLPGKS